MDWERLCFLCQLASTPLHRGRLIFLLQLLTQSQLPSLSFPINLPLFLSRLPCPPVRNSAQNSVFLSRVPREVLTVFGTPEAAGAGWGTPVSLCLFTAFLASSEPTGARSLGCRKGGRGHGPAQLPNAGSERALEMRGCLRPCPWATSSNLPTPEPLD